jgi:hypothetical protein
MVGVAGWFERRGEIPLAPPPRLREYGPLSDDPDRPEITFVGNEIRGVTFVLEYCDSRGWVSTRTIRCLGADRATPAYLRAYCNVRRTARCFRLDRIVAIGDLRTGRVLTAEQHDALLGPYFSQENATPRTRMMMELRDATRDGVFALLHLAMPDGRLGDEPRALILDYLRSESAAGEWPLPAMDAVELWIDNLAPPLDAVTTSVRTLLVDKDKFARLLPWLLKVMRSVGAADEESVRELIGAVRAHYAGRPASRTPSRALR